MQKISGIIPASPRVSQVDLSEARPLRPGVPDFGQNLRLKKPMVNDRVSITSAGQANSRPNISTNKYVNPQEAKRVQIAESVTSSFFAVAPKEKAEEPVPVAQPQYTTYNQTGNAQEVSNVRTPERVAYSQSEEYYGEPQTPETHHEPIYYVA